MTKPLVSIFMPTYNHEAFIEEALDGCLSQTYENFEVVVADDGSTDRTQLAVAEYARRYPGRVVALVGGRHLGVAGNSNRALRACHGEYIALTSGDDVLLPGKLEAQVAWLERDMRRVLCYHDVEVFDSITGDLLFNYMDRYPIRDGDARVLVRHGAFISGTSIMLRAESVPPWGFDERVKSSSDWLFWIECMARSGGVAGAVEGIHARYRRHAMSLSLNQPREHALQDLMVSLGIIEARYPTLIGASRKRRADIFFVEGMRKWLSGERAAALGYLQQSFLTSGVPWTSPLVLLRELRYRQRYHEFSR